MRAILLLYDLLPHDRDPWAPLLQQQAAVAAARAVLAHDASPNPARSEYKLLAPCNLDLLPLLAETARDYTTFAEPEGLERPSAQIILYDDVRGRLEISEDDEMRRLFHPAWFEHSELDLRGAIRRFQPEICISLIGPEQATEIIGDMMGSLSRVVYAKHLSGSAPSAYEADRRSTFVAADEMLKSRVAAAGDRGLAADDPRGTTEEEVDLEPFVAFGPAFEMAIWGIGTEDASR